MSNIFNSGNWQKHFQCTDRDIDIEFLYYNRLPRIARVNYKNKEEALKYLLNRKNFLRPSRWVLIITDNGYKVLKYTFEGYQLYEGNIDTIEIGNIQPIEITENCAGLIVDKIYADNFKWLNDPKSKRVISTIPRIFSESSVVIFELIQNAYDSNATRVKIIMGEGQFSFLHNGDKFTESDVNSISFVNLSTKDKDKVGFMGIGFKAIFLASDMPEIHSSPFSFLFNNKSVGGFILPIKCEKKIVEDNYSTLIYAPLKNHEVYESLNNALLKQENVGNVCISDKTLLHLIKEDDNSLKGIIEIKSPYININIIKGVFDNTYTISSKWIDDEHTKVEQWLRLERKLIPDKEEMAEFLEARDIKGSSLEDEGWEESVSIIIKLNKNDKHFVPDLNLEGLINVYLPTRIVTGLKFDVQGNFLVNAARDTLRNIDGPWNSKLFEQLGDLCIDILIWCKKMSNSRQVLVSAFYNLIPDWNEVKISRKTVDKVKNNFIMRFLEEELVPVEGCIEGETDYVRPNESIIIDREVFELFGKENLEEHTHKKVVLQSLSENSIKKMIDYFDVSVWNISDSIKFLENKKWESICSNFQTLKMWNRQIAKLYSYIYKQLKKKITKRQVCKLLSKCSILPIDWDDGTKNYILQTYTEELYRLHYEMAIDLTPFNKEINILNQSFDNYIRGRVGNLEEDEKRDIEGARSLLELIDIKKLDHVTIIKDFILPVIREGKDHTVDFIIDCTAYVCKYFKELKENDTINIVILNQKGDFSDPNDLYILNGDIEIFFGQKHEELFVSKLYLKNERVSIDNWREFFVNLGVWDKLLNDNKKKFNSYSGEGKKLMEELELPDPKVDNYFLSNYYLIFDDQFGDKVMDRLNEIKSINPKLKRDSMRAFIRILSSNWENYYSPRVLRKINYYTNNQTVYFDTNPNEYFYRGYSQFYTYLINESWVPVINEDDTKMAKDVTILNNETISFINEGVFVCEERINKKMADELRFLPLEAKRTNQERLRRLSSRNIRDIHKYKEIYNAIFSELSGDANKEEEIITFFQENKVIYANEKLWTSKELIYMPDQTISAYFPDLNFIYSEFKERFINILGISESQPTIYHIMQLFCEYIWKDDRTISDEFRNIILYGYRRLLNHLEDCGDEIFKDTPEGKKFKSEAKVFCKKVGWVSINNSYPIIYLDVAKYDRNNSDFDELYIESHLTQLKRDTGDLMKLLNLLNIIPASVGIKEEFSYGGTAVIYSNYETVTKNLLYLMNIVVNIIDQQDYDDGDKSKVNQFIKHVRGLSSLSIFIYKVSEINIMLKIDEHVLFENKKNCCIKEDNGVISIYITNIIKIIYGSLIEELEDLFKVNYLPIIQKEQVIRLITNTIANIEDYFRKSIECFLAENGYKLQEVRQDTVSAVNLETYEETMAINKGNTRVDEDIHIEDIENEPDSENERKNYGSLIESINEENVVIEDIDSDDCEALGVGDVGNNHSSTGIRRPVTKHFSNVFNKEDGDRGEELVLKIEKKRLIDIGLKDYVNKVKHISKTIPTNPWDIESFDIDKCNGLVIPIRVEVKSTTDIHNNTFPMSENELREALAENHNKGELFIYRVYGIRESIPIIKKFNFKEFFIENKINVKTKDVYVEILIKKF